ncbi:MAG: hypothetical protein J6S79_02015, partial [Lachnospiraceae bacterium]|nr:hypothetical protein [Lachnospiraceae bacterium]
RTAFETSLMIAAERTLFFKKYFIFLQGPQIETGHLSIVSNPGFFVKTDKNLFRFSLAFRIKISFAFR